MVLAGSINKEIVGWISGAGGRAVGISGKDGGLVLCEKVLGKREADPNSGIERNVDLGFVGDPVRVDRSILDTLTQNGIIPVVARSEEHTSELQSLMRISYAVFCLKKKHK